MVIAHCIVAVVLLCDFLDVNLYAQQKTSFILCVYNAFYFMYCVTCFLYLDTMKCIIAIFLFTPYINFYTTAAVLYDDNADPLWIACFSMFTQFVCMNDLTTFLFIHTSMYEFVSKRIP
jgi:hypothetical protein